MSKIARIRVSTLDQNIARQEEAFKDLKIDKYFEEKVSGKNIKDRPELNKMMEYAKEGDIDTTTATGKLVLHLWHNLKRNH